MMENYQILGTIGEGSFGRVFRGIEKATGQVFALKFIPKVGHSEIEISTIRREFEIQLSLCHPNVIRMVKYFETDCEVVAVTEFAEGVLFDLFKPGQRRLPESSVRNVAVQLLSAVFYLHSNRIFHRDLKPQNVLLGANGVIKVCDFGFAKVLDVHTYVLTSVKGTPLYMAPEVIEEHPYDHGADLWSVGCILYELLVGAPPFCTGSLVQLVKKVRHDAVLWPNDVSANCLTFLQGLLEKNPLRRFSWQNILIHPFVKNDIFILCDSIPLNPLTNPLTPSQELAKEIQRQDLFQKAPLRTRFLSGMSHHVEARRNSAPLQRGPPYVGFGRPLAPVKALALQRRNTTAQYGGLDPGNNTIVQPLRFNLNPYHDLSNLQICTAQQNIADMKNFSSKITEKMITQNLSTPDLSEKPADRSIKFKAIEFPQSSVNSNSLSVKGRVAAIGSVDTSKSLGMMEDVENEEWTGFLDEALRDALESIETLLNKTMLQMFTGPLKSKNLSPDNLERISTLLILPLMADDKRIEALRLYSEIEVVGMLISAAVYQLSGRRNVSGVSEAVESVINLVSYLCHSQESELFIEQIQVSLEATAAGCEVFREILSSKKFSQGAKRDIQSILAELFKVTRNRTIIRRILTEPSLVDLMSM